ncbi:leucyl/phenylalanyl-tRNA--protein transferase [Shewanella sp.]|uniref:leucyl/phenylalanyl-tRNA--protein transferase n=1 Tax=Shewanella sp. TaxID=50422 RepID=UPI0035655741
MNGLSFIDDEHMRFPSPELALSDPNGLLAIGGSLHPNRLRAAYYDGIFPWFNAEDPILWWSPDPRAIFVPGEMIVSRSLKKSLRKLPWRITLNQAFADVMAGCAQPRNKQKETWITQEIQLAYLEMHSQGYAHSLEVWLENRLVGGLYGMAVGQVFCGESMFHRETDASKIAMLALHRHLQRSGYQLLDAQVMNPHLGSLGAKEVSRSTFLTLLKLYRDETVDETCWHAREVTIGE